jgi:hypothetical protein
MPVRKVSNRGGNAIGRFPSTKMGRMIAFESLLERDFIYLLDYDPAVEWFEEQPVRIEYVHEAKLLHYTPDFRLLECGQQVLVECKPQRFVDTELNRRKIKVGQAWCADCGWQFRLVTDQQVRSGYRLENVKRMTQYARQNENTHICTQILAQLKSAQVAISMQELANAISPASPALVIASILYLAYHHKIILPLDSAPISGATSVFLQEEVQ